MNTIEIDGIRLYYEVRGGGPPLVLVAGLASDSQSWLPVVEPLARRFTVVAYDNRGVGRTTPPDVEIEISLLADDCVALIDRLGYSKVHLLGHSMGGLIAQDVAARHPDRIDRLILVGTGRRTTDEDDTLLSDMARSLEAGTDPETWFRELFRWIFTTRFMQDEATAAESIRLAVEYPYPQTAEQFQKQVDAVARFAGVDPSRIVARTLVMTGEDDVLFPPEEGRSLAMRLPDAEFLLVPSAAHSVHMESPVPFVDAVVRFLSGHESE
jgi:3-oxoadipate enol-lactonase